jgi:hypothetical protein
MVGMPAMPGIAPVDAGQPPAPAGPDLGAPTAALGPGGAPAPNAAIGPDDLMQPGPDLGAPTAPLGSPGGPAAAQSAPVATLPNGQIDTTAEEKKALGEQGQNATDAEAAEKKIGDINATNAAGASTAADAALKAEQQKQIDDQKAIDQANQQTQGWITKAQTDAQKYQGMGLHDYWSDKKTGDKVLAGLSMMFGAAGKTQGGPANNPGMAMIDNAINRDFDTQQANIAKAKSNVETDNQMVAMGLTAKQQALADNNLKKAGALDATAAQLQSYLMKQGVPLAQAQTDQNVATLRAKANATRMETLGKVHEQNVADAKTAIEQQNADSLRLRAEKYKTRGGKGGAGGGSSTDVAAQKFTAWLEKNPDASESEKQSQAIGLGLKISGKPSQTTMKTVEDRVAANAKGGKSSVTLDDGSELQLPSAKAVPQFVKGYNSRTQAKEKLAALLQDVQENGNVYGTDANERRKALIHDANIAVAQISSMGPSDHSSHMELGSLGPVEGRRVPLFGASNDVGIKLIQDKIKQVEEGTQREIHSYRNQGTPLAAGGGAAPTGGAPAAKGGITPQQQARARAVLADPVAKAKLNDKQLAIVTRAAM